MDFYGHIAPHTPCSRDSASNPMPIQDGEEEEELLGPTGSPKKPKSAAVTDAKWKN